MTDRIKGWLDESQRLACQATEGPWDFLPWSKYALPSGDYAESILLANASDDGEIVRGLLDVDGEFIAEARTRFPQAVAALRAVMELHRPVTIYAAETECPSGGDPVHVNDWHEESVTIGGEWYCAQMPLYRACAHCRDEDGGQSDWPCQTARVVAGALGLEGADDDDLG